MKWTCGLVRSVTGVRRDLHCGHRCNGFTARNCEGRVRIVGLSKQLEVGIARSISSIAWRSSEGVGRELKGASIR